MNCLQNATSLRLAVCALATVAVVAPSAAGAVIHVPAQHPTIQAGINAASNGDVVLVADGSYSGTGNYQIDLLGKAIALRSVNGPQATVIDIQADIQNQRLGFYLHQQETSLTIIEGFTIKHGNSFNGAGMMLFNSSPAVHNCIFTENQANCWGGALYYDSGSSPKFTDCKFINNYSTDDGGAIFGFNGSPVFRNCLFSNNDGTLTGGAITTFGTGTPHLINCTVVGNNALWGSAVYSNNVKMTNSIVWDNTGQSEAIYTWAGPLEVTYSIVQGGYEGDGNLSINPQFLDAANGDFHLVRNSPGVDAGDPSFVAPAGAVDIDGDPRIFGTVVDLGIDEYRKTGDITGDHFVNVGDLLAVINGWGAASGNPADLNGDAFINVADLMIVINNWG